MRELLKGQEHTGIVTVEKRVYHYCASVSGRGNIVVCVLKVNKKPTPEMKKILGKVVGKLFGQDRKIIYR